MKAERHSGNAPVSMRMPYRHATWLAGCALALMLSACSDLSRSLVLTVKGSVGKGPALPVSPADVAARPLFQVLATTRHGKALLILGNLDGAREAWYGPSQTALFLEHGRITKTVNLEANLVSSRIVGQDPFATGLQHVHGTVSYDAVEDWSPGFRYGVPVHAVLTRGPMETVVILDRPHQLLRMDETKQSDVASWKVTNHYWVDPATGFIWKSEQTVTPGVTVGIVQLKPRIKGAP